MAGRGSLAGLLSYGDANQIVVEMGSEVSYLLLKILPVLAGVCGTDPFRVMEVFLKQLKDQGFAGVQISQLLDLLMEFLDKILRKLEWDMI